MNPGDATATGATSADLATTVSPCSTATLPTPWPRASGALITEGAVMRSRMGFPRRTVAVTADAGRSAHGTRDGCRGCCVHIREHSLAFLRAHMRDERSDVGWGDQGGDSRRLRVCCRRRV